MSWRSIRDLVCEAVTEALEIASFLIRKADDRYVLPREDEAQK